MEFKDKLRLLRISEGLLQREIAELLGSAEISVRGYEIGIKNPNGRFMQKLCKQFPQYTMWLMTDINGVGSVVNEVPVINDEVLTHIDPRLKKQALMILG